MGVKKLSEKTVLLLLPLVERIDRELAKEQSERQDFKVKSENPTTLKNWMETYKSQYRSDWNQKFQMWNRKHGEMPHVEFKFNLRTITSYSIIEADPMVGKIEILEAPQKFEQDGVPMEISDLEVVGYILSLTPKIVVFISSLEADTQAYLKDPLNVQPTALINLALRSGYKIIPQEEKVRFTYGD